MHTTPNPTVLDVIDQLITDLCARTGRPRPRFATCPRCQAPVENQGGFFARHTLPGSDTTCRMTGQWIHRA